MVMILLLFFGVFSSLFSVFSVQAQNTQKNSSALCHPDDLEALMGFVSEFESGIDGWEIQASEPDCCSWPGVTCGGVETESVGRVVKLEVPRKRLAGKLSESLGSLVQLRTLNLSSNNYLQGPIPVTLLHLPHLEVLDLKSNFLSESLPESISLPAIRFLDISDNNINGSIPAGICFRSRNITVLNLGVNFFSGRVPAGLGDCGSLTDLLLNGNDLSGPLPEDLFLLKGLTRLALEGNKFSGNLPGQIGNLTDLVHLDVSLNNFSGDLPDVFHSFAKLQFFSAQSNNFSGEIPRSLANSPVVSWLYLGNNSLGGKINVNCSAMTSLVLLDLGINRFTGPIPPSLAHCPQLRTLNLAKIDLDGTQIPPEFKNFRSLSALSLSGNKIVNISAALNILQHCKNLTTLILNSNFWGEKMPQSPDMDFSRLKILSISNSRLSGNTPRWIHRCRSLQILDLSMNHLTGAIPTWFQDLNSLYYLDLSSNLLSGEIPVELTRLEALVSRRSSLTNSSSMDVNLFVKRDTSETALQYNQILSFQPTLDASNNKLTGQIWPDFGSLRKLHILDLRFNNLTGTIPSELGSMESLETLDLSHNNLSGSIPASLQALSFLSKLNLSHNKLSGKIPNGGQFSTFPSSSFEGNTELCGKGSHPCDESASSPEAPPGLFSSQEESLEFSGVDMAIGAGIFFFILSFALEMHLDWTWNFLHSYGCGLLPHNSTWRQQSSELMQVLPDEDLSSFRS